MNNNILLRNITQGEVCIDLTKVPVKKTLTGFYCLSEGLHYVSVTGKDSKQIGFWCYFKEKEGIVAKSFDEEKQTFEEWNGKEAEYYKQLALDEEMDDDLMPYPKESRERWGGLVFYIKKLGRFPSLNKSIDSNLSFTQLFNEVHKGDIVSTMAEFQFAFVRMAILPMGEKDEEAVERWKEMMRIFYSAAEEEIERECQFFIDWIGFLFNQFETLPDITFQRTGESTTYNVIVKNAATLCDKLMKCSDEETVISGKRLRLYLTQRGAQL